jgi:hypothetical protein
MDRSTSQDNAVTRLPDPRAPGEEDSASTGQMGILAQLRDMIRRLTAAPATREFAAQAADLAAAAAEKAGPTARSLAARTEEVGQAVAERATTFASSMRADEAGHGDAPRRPAEDSGV